MVGRILEFPDNRKLSFVTITYEGELPLLRLQASSMARFIPADIIEEIIILVNDVNEERVIDTIKQDYICEYGHLADKVRVLNSSAVFIEHNKNLWSLFLNYWAKRPQYRFRKKAGGWEGNKGWAMQQAFKLCSVRVARAQYIVMLDSKNVFIRPQDLNAFVDAEGRPRTSFIPMERMHERWLPPSCKALKLNYSKDLFKETTRYVTPYVIETSLLKMLVNRFEQIHGALHGVFARRFIKPTEFMLINAYCLQKFNGIRSVFADGLVQPSSFFTASTSDKIDGILDDAQAGRASILGLHVAVMGRLSEQQLSRLKNILVANKIVASDFDINELQKILQNKNKSRVQNSLKRLDKRNRR